MKSFLVDPESGWWESAMQRTWSASWRVHPHGRVSITTHFSLGHGPSGMADFFFPSGFLWIIPGLKNERCWGFTNCIHGHPGSLMILIKVYKDEFVYSFRCLIMKKCYVALSAVWRPSCLPYLYFIFVNCRLNLWISGSIRIKTLELLPISGRILKPEFPHHNMAIIVIFQNNSFLGPGNKTYNIKWFCRIWNVINKEVLF